MLLRSFTVVLFIDIIVEIKETKGTFHRWKRSILNYDFTPSNEPLGLACCIVSGGLRALLAAAGSESFAGKAGPAEVGGRAKLRLSCNTLYNVITAPTYAHSSRPPSRCVPVCGYRARYSGLGLAQF